MKNISFSATQKIILIQMSLAALAFTGPSARAQITVSPSGLATDLTPYPIPAAETVISTVPITAATAFTGVQVIAGNANPYATVILGQTGDSTLSLTNATVALPEISLAATSSNSVSVASTVSITDSDAGPTPTAISITGGTYDSVTNQGTITEGAAAGSAVEITTSNASVTNSNTIDATTGGGANAKNGVLLDVGGTVSNGAAGTIFGDANGVVIGTATMGTGTVTNLGTIYTSSVTGKGNDGVLLGAGGTVSNTGVGAGGSLEGLVNGVEIDGGTVGGNTVTNAGTGAIYTGTTTGTSNDGVLIKAAGGSVSNTTGGINGFFDGVEIGNSGAAGDTGTVTNSGGGTIGGLTTTGLASENDGVQLDFGGTVSNSDAGSSILGVINGVEIDNGTASSNIVNNSATIQSDTAGNGGNDGIVITGGGTVNNTASTGSAATITGATYGVEIGSAVIGSSTTGAVNNTGIIGTTTLTPASAGVALDNGGTVTNSGAGTILGNVAGVLIAGANGATVMNSSTDTTTGIEGKVGVLINSPDSTATPVTVTNSGFVQGTLTDGVNLQQGGTVNNSGSGNITGLTNGVQINGTNGGTVTNSATITGNTATSPDSGVLIDATAATGSITVTNLGGGTITGGYDGVDVTAASGTVNNSGTIQDAANDGVELDNGGTVNNGPGGVILGNVNGVEIGLTAGTGTVNNAGTIGIPATIPTNAGVLLDNGGNVTNSGTILGGTSGIDIVGVGASSTVINSGGITAPTGILVTGAGTADLITNSGDITSTTVGISAAGNNSVITLAGGSITAGAGNSAVVASGTGSTVVIDGHTTLSPSTGAPAAVTLGTGGTVVLNVFGVAPSNLTALEIAGTPFTIGGSTYSFSVAGATAASFTNNVVSFGGTVDSGLGDLGNKLDANGLPATAAFNAFYSAAALDPESAVANLSGRVITQTTNDLMINSMSGLTSALGNQFDDIIDTNVIGGIDLTHFNIGTNQELAFVDTSSQLENLVNQASGSQLGVIPMNDSKDDSKGMTEIPSPGNRWGVWLSGTVQIADKDNSNGNPGFNALNGSPSIGVDYRITPNVTVGSLFSFTTAEADVNDGSKVQANTELGGLYGLWAQNGWRVHAVAAGGASQYDNTRSTLAGTATSKPGGSDVVSDVTGGYDFKLGGGALRITPEVGVQYTYLHQDAFTETGAAPFAISRSDFDENSLRTHLGFRTEYTINGGNGLKFTPQFRAAWYHECLDGSESVNTGLTGAPALGSFTVRTFSPQRDYALVGFGLDTSFNIGSTPMGVFLNYDLQVGQDDFLQHNVNGGVELAF